jgi:hypothetical protein
MKKIHIIIHLARINVKCVILENNKSIQDRIPHGNGGEVSIFAPHFWREQTSRDRKGFLKYIFSKR